jgi:hypothetical protein
MGMPLQGGPILPTETPLRRRPNYRRSDTAVSRQRPLLGLLHSSASTAAAGQDVSLLTAEVRHLRDDVAQLQQSVAHLQDAETFHRSLTERAAPPQIAPPPESPAR